MGRITSGVGLASGIDHRAIIDQLMSLESRPKEQLQDRIDKANERKIAYTDLSTRMAALRLTGTALKKPSTFQASVTTSGNEDVLTATASNGAAVGDYQFQVARLVTTQQAVTGGFADHDKTKVGAGTLTMELGGGDLATQTLLSQLNGGAGVGRGSFRITDRGGASAVVDISAAVTLDDVVKRINTALGVSVKASISGDKLVITDLTGKTANNLTIADLGDGRAAAGLGIAADVAAANIDGTDINAVGAKTRLDDLNDGRGVRRLADAAGADFQITAGDGTTFDITLGSAGTVGEVLDLINTATAGKVKAEVVAGANGIRLTDASGGGGAFTVAALNNSRAAADLGIEATGAAGVIEGSQVLAGLNTVLLSSLRGGTGLTLGQITVTDRAGATATVDLSAAKTVQDILDGISNAAGVNVTASLKASGNGIQITDDTGGTADLVIADAGGGTLAAQLGIAGTFASTTPAVQGANLQRQWVGENNTLASYNGGKGVTKGTFKITNSAGASADVDLSQGTETRLADVINEINAKGIGVTASVNANGDGLLLTDTAGGAGKMKVEEVDSTTAADLNLLGTATTTTIDGSFEKTLTLDATDTLATVQIKLNEMNFGASAAIVNDGSGGTPYRLSLTARNTGRAGRVVFDGGATLVQTRNLVDAQDAAVFVGSADSDQPLLVTSSKNQITGVVQGVTIELHGTSDRPVSLGVTRSPDAMVEQLVKFAENFNAAAEKLKELTKFDTEAEKRGLLLGESTAQAIETNLYTMFTGVVTSAGRYRTAADAGLKLSNGVLEFDEAKFREAFASDPESLQTLFTNSVSALTPQTQLTTLNNGRGVRTAPGGAADFRVTTKDGAAVDITLGPVNSLGDVLGKMNAAGAGKFTVAVSDDGSRLVIKDVSGTGTGPFKVEPLNGSVAATDLKIVANGTDGLITGAKLLDVTRQLSVSAGTGVGYLIENSMTRLTDPVDGAITRENKNIEERNLQFQDRIESLDKLLTSKRERLERQFAQMESVLSGLQSQQSSLAALQNMPTISR